MEIVERASVCEMTWGIVRRRPIVDDEALQVGVVSCRLLPPETGRPE
ncbi:hypothetical protein [Nonomuraea guangzhouensis]|uniref:Uncharacterized protein n=1 Tax=Nonomuraea guangzhouensis TaxID=1291555 RepID=A0ABW4GU57_9ACTN|nr:hypothetical protein [Nonomuraea guangzhouensis]